MPTLATPARWVNPWAIALWWGLLPGMALSEEPTWATGRALQEHLAAPVTVLWESNPLRSAIMGLSRSQRVAVLIDRRVDPGRKLEISLKQVPLESALKTIALSQELGVCRLPWGLYLGPPAAAERFEAVRAALAGSVHRLPPAGQRKYRQAQRLAWADFSTPRELVGDLTGRNGIEITNLNEIPHDLWASASFPSMSLADRLLAITIQYDLTLKFSSGGTRVELAAIPEDLPPVAKRGRDIAGPRSPPRTPPDRRMPDKLSGQRHTLTVHEKPLEPVLQQLAKRIDFDLRIDRKAIEAAGISLDQRVSVHVENATLDELLRSLLQSTGLSFHRTGRVVEIVPEGRD